MHDLGIDSSGRFLRLVVDEDARSSSNFSLILAPDIKSDEKCSALIDEVRLGLEMNRAPGKSDIVDSSSGVYFMRNANGQKVAVFKPLDEEQGMPHNPKGYAGKGEVGLREHFAPGQGYVREFIAYKMDVDHFCQVPETIIVHCEHPSFCYANCELGNPFSLNGKKAIAYPKPGSLQRYVRAGEPFEDLGYGKLR